MVLLPVDYLETVVETPSTVNTKSFHWLSRYNLQWVLAVALGHGKPSVYHLFWDWAQFHSHCLCPMLEPKLCVTPLPLAIYHAPDTDHFLLVMFVNSLHCPGPRALKICCFWFNDPNTCFQKRNLSLYLGQQWSFQLNAW